MNRTYPLLTAVGAALVFSVPLGAHGGPTLAIRHQTRGCHTWSLNGGPYLASQFVRLRLGSGLTVANMDGMPHKLIKTSGPRVTMTKTGTILRDKPTELEGTGVMAHVGAAIELWFKTPGTYTFTTRFGKNYAPAVETVGRDNALELKVVVG